MKPPEAAYIEAYLLLCVERLAEAPIKYSNDCYITSDWVEDDLEVWYKQWTRYRKLRFPERQIKVDAFIAWMLGKSYYTPIGDDPRIGTYANYVFKIKLHALHEQLRD